MAILIPLQVPAAESLPAPLDTAQILRLVYPGGVLPADVSETVEVGRERPITPPTSVAAVRALDRGTMADSLSNPAPSGTALVAAAPNHSGVPDASPSAAVTGARKAMPVGMPAFAPAPLDKDVIAALASGDMQVSGKSSEPPQTVTAPAASEPGSSAQPEPSPQAIAPEPVPEPKPETKPPAAMPPVAMPDRQPQQQAVLPETKQHNNVPQQQAAPPETMQFSRPQRQSIPPAAVPSGWPQQYGMPPETMRYYQPQQQPVPQAVQPYGRPVQLPITQQQLDVLLNVFGPALQR